MPKLALQVCLSWSLQACLELVLQACLGHPGLSGALQACLGLALTGLSGVGLYRLLSGVGSTGLAELALQVCPSFFKFVKQ